MEGICVGKGIVIRMKFTFELFGYKTMSSCVYNKTAEKQSSFSSLVVWDNAYNLMRWDFNGSVGGIVMGVTLVALIRFVVCCVDRYECIV